MFSISFVPTGLVLSLMHNPGTEVPGYSHLVPTGRKMAKLQTWGSRPGLSCGTLSGSLNLVPFGSVSD